MLYYVVFSGAMHYSYICCTITSASAWLHDCILDCTVPLLDFCLSSLKQIAVTSAMHERSMRDY